MAAGLPPDPPLDPTLSPGQSGHIDDHEVIAGTLAMLREAAGMTVAEIGTDLAAAGAVADALALKADTADLGTAATMTPTEVVEDAGARAVLDGAFAPVFGVTAYGATGDGTTDDTTAIQAAIDACEAAGGGVVYFPVGTYRITDTLTIVGAAQDDGWSAGGVTLRGAQQKASQINVEGGIDAIHIGDSTKMMIHLEDLELNGPGQATAGSRGIFWENPGGASTFRNLYIHDFEVGVEHYDSTLGTYINVNIRECDIGWRTGYNVDIHTWVGSRIENCETGIYIGVTSVSHSTAQQFNNAITFLGCRLSNNTVRAGFINDTVGSSFMFQGCYFESNPKEFDIGTTTGDGPSGVCFESCFFTPVTTTPVAVGFDVQNRTTIDFRNCSTDGQNRYTIFLKFNDEQAPAGATFENCYIDGATATVQYGGRNYLDTLGKRERICVGQPQINQHNGAYLPASNIWRVHGMAGGTGKTWDSWTRLSSSTGATLAEMQLYDTGGVMRFGGVGSTPGYICATSVTALPTASVNYRGALAFVAGGAEVADAVYWCRKNASDGYEWQALA